MFRALIAAALSAALLSASASAAEVQVKMLNKGAEGTFVFEPALVKIQPGDSVRFVPSDKGHNAESIEGMIPDGAAPFNGKMGDEIVVTFDKPGVYGFKCKPHYPMGMVGMIVVGAPANTEAAKAVAQPGKAKSVFAGLFEKLAASTSASSN
jgi:pseudoazurin